MSKEIIAYFIRPYLTVKRKICLFQVDWILFSQLVVTVKERMMATKDMLFCGYLRPIKLLTVFLRDCHKEISVFKP